MNSICNFSKPVDRKSGSGTVLVNGMGKAVWPTFTLRMFSKEEWEPLDLFLSRKVGCQQNSFFHSLVLSSEPQSYSDSRKGKEDKEETLLISAWRSSSLRELISFSFTLSSPLIHFFFSFHLQKSSRFRNIIQWPRETLERKEPANPCFYLSFYLGH